MREDLSPVYGTVQACHAAIGGGQFLISKDIPHPHIVLCRATSEADLLKIAKRLESEDVLHYLFSEPDIGNQYTSLITQPIFGEQRRLFRRYQCFREFFIS